MTYPVSYDLALLLGAFAKRSDDHGRLVDLVLARDVVGEVVDGVVDVVGHPLVHELALVLQGAARFPNLPA